MIEHGIGDTHDARIFHDNLSLHCLGNCAIIDDNDNDVLIPVLVSGHELHVQPEEVAVAPHHAEARPTETLQIRPRVKFILSSAFTYTLVISGF